jgi:hypothetical protein
MAKMIMSEWQALTNFLVGMYGYNNTSSMTVNKLSVYMSICQI